MLFSGSKWYLLYSRFSSTPPPARQTTEATSQPRVGLSFILVFRTAATMLNRPPAITMMSSLYCSQTFCQFIAHLGKGPGFPVGQIQSPGLTKDALPRCCPSGPSGDEAPAC